jgi:hypothetical protein
MKLLKQALAVLGTVVVIAVFVALVTPKTAHAIVATAVQVVNTSANPVPIRDTQDPALSAFTVEGTCHFTASPDCTLSSFFSFTPGQIAVIESINSHCTVDTGTSATLYISYINSSITGAGQIVVPFNSAEAVTFGGFTSLATLVSTRAYAGSNGIQPIQASWDTNVSQSGGFEFCTATLSGHLVSPPL